MSSTNVIYSKVNSEEIMFDGLEHLAPIAGYPCGIDAADIDAIDLFRRDGWHVWTADSDSSERDFVGELAERVFEIQVDSIAALFPPFCFAVAMTGEC